MSPDLPFVRREGHDHLIALHNRVACLERIKYLTGIDLRDKPKEYKLLIDAELYMKYYKDLPSDIPIDEDFCQRSAEVIRMLESEKDLSNALEGASERVKQLHTESKQNIPIQPLLKTIKKKETWLDKVKCFFFTKPEMVGQFFKCKTRKV